MAVSRPKPVPRLLAAGLVALDVIRREGRYLPHACRVGGTAGNVASILGALGWDAMAAGPAEESAAFRVLIQDLHECGVQYYATNPGSIPVIVQELRECGHSFSFECPDCGSALPRFERSARAAPPVLSAYSRGADVFFADRLSDDVIALAQAAHAQGAFIVYEPSDRADAPWASRMLEMAGMVKCSSERAPALGWLDTNPGEYLEVHTLGAEGLRWRWPRLGVAAWRHLPAVAADRVVDTCGAGDWLTSGILFGLRDCAGELERGAERRAEQVLRDAQRLAAWSCGFAGARGALYEVGPRAARGMLGPSRVGGVRTTPVPEPSAPMPCLTCPG